MAIPIFFVCKTNSSYLKYALKQARKFNPDSFIYLLGDESNNVQVGNLWFSIPAFIQALVFRGFS